MTSSGTGPITFGGAWIRSEVSGEDGLTIVTGGTNLINPVIGDNNQALKHLNLNTTGLASLNGNSFTTTEYVIINSPVVLNDDLIINTHEIQSYGTIDLNSHGLSINNTEAMGVSVVESVISGTGDFVKSGVGLISLTSDSTYTGETRVMGGTLYLADITIENSSEIYVAQGAILDADTGSGTAIVIPDGQTVSGEGTFEPNLILQVGSIVRPGSSPGALSTGALSAGTGTIFQIEIDGPTAGLEYDQLIANGNVHLDGNGLGGATLGLTINYLPANGTEFKLIDNISNDLTIGQFLGFSHNSVVDINNMKFAVSYTGGNGNDFTLTKVANDCETITSGLWSTSSTWTNCSGSFPNDFDSVTIKSGHEVTLDINSASLDGFVIEAGGDFAVATSVSGLTLSGSENNSNTFDLSQASINLEGDFTIDVTTRDILLNTIDGAFTFTLNSAQDTKLMGEIGSVSPLQGLITVSYTHLTLPTICSV